MKNRLPAWLRQNLPTPEALQFSDILRDKFQLNTVCHSAKCPNRPECFSRKHATFLILGNRCTRNCLFCNIDNFNDQNEILTVESDEPERIAQAAQYFNLEYVVITSVTRDDLLDGGAEYFAKTIKAIRKEKPLTKIEALIPDFKGSQNALKEVLNEEPEVISHNLETVRTMYPLFRQQADYNRSLDLLRYTKLFNPNQITKSSLMLGLGETDDELKNSLDDLRRVNCDMLVLGQYLRPSLRQYPVQKYYSPDEFEYWKNFSYSLGFKSVCASPLARTSYLAKEQEQCMMS